MTKVTITFENGKELSIEPQLSKTKEVFVKYQHLSYQIFEQKSIQYDPEKPVKDYPWVPLHETLLSELWDAINKDLSSEPVIIPVTCTALPVVGSDA